MAADIWRRYLQGDAVCLLGNVLRFHGTSDALTVSLTFENCYLPSYIDEVAWDNSKYRLGNSVAKYIYELNDFLINLSY